jgi:hypothetical protein
MIGQFDRTRRGLPYGPAVASGAVAVRLTYVANSITSTEPDAANARR